MTTVPQTGALDCHPAELGDALRQLYSSGELFDFHTGALYEAYGGRFNDEIEPLDLGLYTLCILETLRVAVEEFKKHPAPVTGMNFVTLLSF